MKELAFSISAVGTFAAIVLIVYFLVRSLHEQRMALIRKGVNPLKYRRTHFSGQYSLFWGILCFSLGMGWTLALLFTGHWKDQHSVGAFGFSLAAILGGIGFIVNWKVTAPEREQMRKMLEQQFTRTGTDFAPDPPAEKLD